jgi:hypothetical protein
LFCFAVAGLRKLRNTIRRLSQAAEKAAENLAATNDLQKEALRNQKIITQQSASSDYLSTPLKAPTRLSPDFHQMPGQWGSGAG